MDSLWHKFNNKEILRKRQTLYSICIGFVFFIILFILSKIFKGSLCLFKHIFGISCFGCGMTRGFISILKLNFFSAFRYNALSIPVFIGIAVYSVCAIIDVLFNKNYVCNMEKQLGRKYMFILYVIILTVSII